MATEIIMPKAGVAMEEGTIVQWLVQPGDEVETGDIILEIETDKVSMEVEAEVSGYFLGATREPGDVVPVTQTIGYIGKKGESMPAAGNDEGGAGSGGAGSGGAGSASVGKSGEISSEVSGAGSTKAPAQSESTDGPIASGEAAAPRIAASPAAVRLAREKGVRLEDALSGSLPLHSPDIEVASSSRRDSGNEPRMSSLARRELQRSGHDAASLTGSGSGGRILRRDVNEQLSGIMAMLEGLGGFVPPADVPVHLHEGDTSQPLSGIRKVTAQRMITSQLTIPPTTLHCEVKANQISSLRASLKADGIALSVNVLLLKAVARALRQCPWMRVSMSEGQVIQREAVNLGMAVATDRGLLVPVIRHADRLSLVDLGEAASDLADKARNGRLSMDDMSGGVFSVSNLGMYGITTFTPVVNPPEAGILGIGTIRKQLARDEVSGEIVDRQLMDLSLTLDHRLIDGAQGALFLTELRELLEAPLKLLAGG